MADRAVPALDPLIGYYRISDNGKLDFETFQVEFATLRFALVDLLKNPNVKEIFFSSGGIWLRLTLPDLTSPIKVNY